MRFRTFPIDEAFPSIDVFIRPVGHTDDRPRRLCRPLHAQAPSTPKVQAGDGHPYEIADSEVWDVPDPVSKRGYQVFVALPPSYAKQPQRRYPVLYVTDADYAFPIIRQLGRRLNVEGPKIEEFILVGLSMQKARKAESAANVITRRHPTAQAPPRQNSIAGPSSSLAHHHSARSDLPFYGALLGTQMFA